MQATTGWFASRSSRAQMDGWPVVCWPCSSKLVYFGLFAFSLLLLLLLDPRSRLRGWRGKARTKLTANASACSMPQRAGSSSGRRRDASAAPSHWKGTSQSASHFGRQQQQRRRQQQSPLSSADIAAATLAVARARSQPQPALLCWRCLRFLLPQPQPVPAWPGQNCWLPPRSTLAEAGAGVEAGAYWHGYAAASASASASAPS